MPTIEQSLLNAHRKKDRLECLRLFELGCNTKKVTEKLNGLYMIGVPRMFVHGYGRVGRATAFLKSCFEEPVWSLFNAITECVKNYFKLEINEESGDKAEDTWALYSALSLKYWVGDVQVSDLSTLFGKVNMRVEAMDSSFAARRKKWLTDIPLHTYDGSESKFYNKFEAVCDDMFRRVGAPKEVISFEDYVADFGTWARSGAVQRREFNAVSGVKKTKWAFALYNSFEEVMAFLEKEHGRNVVYEKFIKPEQAGARWALTGALASHIIMGYISYHLDPLLASFPNLFIFWNPDKQAVFWAKRQSQSRQGRWFVTGDYSGWDEGVTHRMTTLVAQRILRWSKGWAPEFTQNWGIDVLNALNNFSVDGIKCANGLPTGSRWTMMLNSLMNCILQTMAAEKSGCFDFATVGDDFDVCGENEDQCKAHLAALADMGFTTAAHKTGVYKGHGEFLKNYYSDNYLVMSPFRAVRALLYAQDMEKSETDAERRLARTDLWARLMGRLRNWARIPGPTRSVNMQGAEWLMEDDLFIAFSKTTTKNIIFSWLRTPSTVGGAGLLPQKPGLEWYAIRSQTEASKITSFRFDVLLRKQSNKGILSRYMTTKVVESFVAKKLPRSFTMAVGLGRPEWAIHVGAILFNFFPTPRVILPPSVKSRPLPVDKKPIPDSRGIYTAKMFGSGNFSFNDVKNSMDTGAYYVDKSGRKFTEVGLYEFEFVRWVRNLRGVSAAVKGEILRSGGNFPTPRELFSLFGETLAGVIWSVAKPTISRVLLKPGATADSLLMGLIECAMFFNDRVRDGVSYTLSSVTVKGV